MSTSSLRSLLLKGTIASAVLGVGIIAYVVCTVFGVSGDQFSLVFHPFAAFYGGYLIFMAFALRKNFCARRVHQYFSAIFVPVGLIAIIAILGSGKTTTWLRAGMAFAAFILIGALYKYALAKFGAALFGKEIRE